MRPRRSAPWAPATGVLAVMALLVLAGCGAGVERLAPEELAWQAAQRSEAAGTGEFTLRWTDNAVPDEPSTLEVTGRYDGPRRLIETHTEPETLDMDATGVDPASIIGPMDVFVEGPWTYTRTLTGPVSTGDRWALLDPVGDDHTVLLRGDFSVEYGDPRLFFAFLAGMAPGATIAPDDTVGPGVVHVSGHLDLDRAHRLLPRSTWTKLARQVHFLRDLLGSRGLARDVDAWIDRDGLVRRLRVTFDLDWGYSDGGPAAGAGDDLVVEVAFSDLGDDPRLEAPRGWEVMSPQERLGAP